MATSIFFSGRLISVPGSYSEIDASGLEQVGLGAAGIVALLGTAEGGRPYSAIESVDDFVRLRKPEAVRQTFRSGDLREGGAILFEPSSDANILAGAQEVVAMKVNPALQGAATFSNSQGDALDVTAADWGAFTNQINIAIGDGTSQGKLITITFEDVVETGDDIGGDTFFSLSYTDPGTGWENITTQCLATGIIQCLADSGAVAGLDGDVSSLLAQGAARVVSADAGDIGQTVTLYGLDATGNPASEVLTLNGTTPVDGSQVWGAGDLLGARITGTTAGAVTVSDQVIPTTVMTLAAGTNTSKGLFVAAVMYAASALSIVASGASTADVIVVGRNAAGAVTLEKLTLNGTNPVAGTTVWSEILYMVLGDTAAGVNVTWSGTAGQTDPAVQSTLQKVVDYFEARSVGANGFAATLVTTLSTLDPSNLDVMSAAVTIDGATHNFLANLYALVTWINSNSELVTAAAATGAEDGFPDNTTAPVFLSGGSEGTTAFADWQAAIDLLKQIRVNTLVPLTGDPSVHAAVESHCAFMGGVGRSERDAVCGALNTGLTDVPSKTEYKSQAVDLNSRHVRLIGQAIERYNTSGVRAEFLPPFTACVVAGMQAGSTVGTSLTYKYANILGFRQDSSWNPIDDAEELIQAGLCILENVDGVGRRWVRNVTTYLISNNVAFQEASVNEATNYAAYNFRTNMEIAVGQPGFTGTINAAKGIAITTLGLLVDAGVLVGYRSLEFELVVDTLEVEVEIAPVIPINFVKNILHLVTAQQLAA